MRKHKESIFFGLSARQFLCAVSAVCVAAGLYLGLGPAVGKETASWLCMLSAAPMAAAGFFSYNGMTLERFIWAVVKSELLFSRRRRFAAENFHYRMLGRKQGDDFD